MCAAPPPYMWPLVPCKDMRPKPSPSTTYCVCCSVHEYGLVSHNPPAAALSKQTHLQHTHNTAAATVNSKRTCLILQVGWGRWASAAADGWSSV